ncbi:MAG: hypothetical protein A4S09_03850 [Proteobacteria bacterium SG_bin7]|nr:MAG: hypothetical protein A4S09_03850 [Proteobacteria bacterium SG_bin7]
MIWWDLNSAIKKHLWLWPVLLLTTVALKFQNCTGGENTVLFSNIRGSIESSSMQGGSYDGKPSSGSYCRVYDDLTCQSNVPGLQSLLTVNDKGIHLVQDNCASATTNFLFNDVAIKFSTLLPDYIGVSRGIFVKCELDTNNLPKIPEAMPDAYCVSQDNRIAAIVNKNLITSQMNLSLTFDLNGPLRRAKADNLIKRIANNGDIIYSSIESDLDLTITKSTSQTSSGSMRVVVDDLVIEKKLNCRTSSPLPTVIVESDMELSSTWINTTQLVGYWKLNEANAVEGTTIVDSSSFANSGILETGSDGLVKSNSTAKGGAIAFDGVNDNIRIADPMDGRFDFGMGSFSYMVWIKKSGNVGAFDIALSHGNGGGVNQRFFDIECGSACYAAISDGTGNQNRSSAMARFAAVGAPTFVGQWTFLLAVVDRSTQQFRAYVNGVLVWTTDISQIGSVTSASQGNTRIGGIVNDGSYPFFGLIDDVAIWNRALSDSEITEIFQRLRPKFY